LNTLMKEKNSLLLLKPHANTFVDSEMYKTYENILFADKNMDVYPVLPYTDVLITDYSSILYDYILMTGKNLILYVYDYHEYANQRDFYKDYLNYIPGKICFSFDELTQCLQTDDFQIKEDIRDEVITKFWGKNWNKSIAEISEEIISKTVK